MKSYLTVPSLSNLLEGQAGLMAEPDVNATMLNELMLTGVPELAAKHALINTGNSSSELAISWYFEHMADPSLSQPLARIKKAASEKFTEENVGKLIEFGFTREQAIFGLSNTVSIFTTNRTITLKELLNTFAAIQ